MFSKVKKNMSKLEWSPNELNIIFQQLDGLCADIYDEPENYEVCVRFNHRDNEHEISPHCDRPNELHYTIRKLYRNSKGDVIDDEIIKNEIYNRSQLKMIVKKMVSEIRY